MGNACLMATVSVLQDEKRSVDVDPGNGSTIM